MIDSESPSMRGRVGRRRASSPGAAQAGAFASPATAIRRWSGAWSARRKFGIDHL